MSDILSGGRPCRPRVAPVVSDRLRPANSRDSSRRLPTQSRLRHEYGHKSGRRRSATGLRRRLGRADGVRPSRSSRARPDNRTAATPLRQLRPGRTGQVRLQHDGVVRRGGRSTGTVDCRRRVRDAGRGGLLTCCRTQADATAELVHVPGNVLHGVRQGRQLRATTRYRHHHHRCHVTCHCVELIKCNYTTLHNITDLVFLRQMRSKCRLLLDS